CGALVADLRELRAAAGSLPVLAPSRDLWPGVAARIETPVVHLNRGGTAAQPGSRFGRRVWLGLAAAALVTVTATVTREMSRRAAPQATPANPSPVSHVAAQPADSTTSNSSTSSSGAKAVATPAPPRAAVSLASNTETKISPEATYDHEIEKLRVIVDAIAQCRTALKKDPASGYLMQSLDDALDTKVQMMRTVAMLPSRS